VKKIFLPIALLALVLADSAARSGHPGWFSRAVGLLGSGLMGRAAFFLLGLAALSVPALALGGLSRLQARRRERRALAQPAQASVELTPAREKA
jgi:hypothetical protein